MNSITIYRYRLKQYRQFKRKVWLLANDWSVSLYILLPIALLLLFNWISWWGSKQIFLEVHQLRVIGGWLFLYCWFGNLFMAVEEADKVFLLGMRTLITSLRTISLYYSLQKYATHTVLLFVYLLPLFIQCLLINILAAII
ncbi:ABC transporter permease [Paenibacillus larvae]|uniref:ABC transporter permease n=1 Tax=Paenibacillus larvae TaxID=1464 RepID=UPI0028541738|nr:ABC transporter permease [Paenibacillus larvae]MDR5595071.1 ABC transporter permease [Paenibacillus larvae]